MIFCAGAALVDCIIKGDTSEAVAEDIAVCAGGEAYNEACTLAALGEEVVLCAPIGDDDAGHMLISGLEARGAGVTNCGYTGRTPVSILAVQKDGSRRSTLSRVHELRDFLPVLPEVNPEYVTMASLFRPPFLSPEVCRDFALKAREKGAVLFADTKLPKGSSPVLEDYRDTLRLLDYITPNEEEMRYYTKKDEPREGAAVFHSLGVKNVIVKMAEKGCFISSHTGEQFYLPALKVECVDGIGAGDAFVSGLIHALRKGMSLREAAVFATGCAAICVTGRGAVGALLSEQQVFDMLSQNS